MGTKLKNGKVDLRKFDPKSYEGIFIVYLSASRSYKIYNKRTLCIKESVHAIFYETGDIEKLRTMEDFEMDEIT